MNIFYLDKHPETCAQYHVDRHCVKMVVEYAQILSTAQNECDGYYAGSVYRSFNPKHPSCLWVTEGVDNYKYVFDLWSSLSREYTYRFGKTHKTYESLKDKLGITPNVPSGGTPLRLAMPDEYKDEDPVTAYRGYYLGAKRTDSKGNPMFVWTNRTPPPWVKRGRVTNV